MSRYFVKFSLLLALVVLTAFPVRAAEIGAVAEVISYAYGTPPETGEKSALYARDGILVNHLVETVTDGGLHIKFVDGTDLRLGSKSSLVIDKYVFDPGNPNQAGVFQMTAGVFRIITGNMKSEAYELNTPVAIIGIRGSDVEIEASQTRTRVSVRVGAAKVTNRRDGSSVNVPAGQSATANAEGGASITGTAPAKPKDKSLRAKNERAGSGGGRRGGGGSSSCFAQGTQVLMADGSARNIEDVRMGDLVVGLDGSVNRVTGIERPTLDGRWLYALNNGRPFVTAEHPFLTEEGWQSIDPQATFEESPATARQIQGALAVGDRLVTSEGGAAISPVSLASPDGIAVRDLMAVAKPPTTVVYNLLLDGDHTYRVREDGRAGGWYIVHNKYN